MNAEDIDHHGLPFHPAWLCPICLGKHGQVSKMRYEPVTETLYCVEHGADVHYVTGEYVTDRIGLPHPGWMEDDDGED